MAGKISELQLLTGAAAALDDSIEVLDKSRTTGPDSAPTGANSRMPWSEVIAFLAANGVGGVTDGNKGDVTVTGSSWQINANAVGTTEIANNAVTAAKLPAMNAYSFWGRQAGYGQPDEIDLNSTKNILGINNVNNTSDVNKPVSTATQTALDAKQISTPGLNSLAGVAYTAGNFIYGNGSGWSPLTTSQVKITLNYTKADVGLGNVDNTADINKPISNDVAAALVGKQPIDSDLTAIAALAQANGSVIQSNGSSWFAATTAQQKTALAITKTDVGLANVDNTSDANKPVSTAQATAIGLKADKTTTINTTFPLLGGATLAGNITLDIALFNTTQAGAVPPPGSLTGAYLKDNGTWATPPGITDGDKTDITVSGGGAFWNIDANAITTTKIADYAVTLPKMANMAGSSILGNSSGGTNVVAALPMSTVMTMLTAASETASGIVELATLAETQTGADTTRAITPFHAMLTYAPVRSAIRIDTNLSPVVLLTDENKLISLTSGSAITITLPSDATTNFQIGAQITYAWSGVGQPTFVAGSGATVNATPGLKLRAQYSMATALKMASNTWVVTGDLSA